MIFSYSRILVAEDEFLVALSLEQILDDLGCRVAGPHASVEATAREAMDGAVDAAILDINLRGESVLPAAEILLDRGVPLAFCSGYADLSILPAEFAACPRLLKPYGDADIRRLVGKLLAFPAGSALAQRPVSGMSGTAN